MSRERMRIAQDMHDEIGSKLARISFLSEVVKTEATERFPHTDVVDSLAKTARDLLQSLDRMVWAVNPRNDSLENLASYLNRYASEYFQSTAIQCQLAIPRDLPKIPLSAEIRHNIFLAFEETLTNAIKHSGATRVNVKLTVDRDVLFIAISDNGTGFDLAAKPAFANGDESGECLGLSGLHRRMLAIGGKCELESAPGKGTVVTFRLGLPQVYA
jgi:signal transduction histidine kinase